MFIIPKVIYRWNVILIKISMAHFAEIAKKNSQIRMDSQKTLESKHNAEKKSKTEGIITLELKLYYKTILIKTG